MNRITTFEVQVEIILNKKSLGKFIKIDKIIKMFHIEANKPEKARKKAERYGRPISVRKLNTEKLFNNMNYGIIDNQPIPNPYQSAVAMDEMIWMKRNNRIKNKEKDKQGIDKANE